MAVGFGRQWSAFAVAGALALAGLPSLGAESRAPTVGIASWYGARHEGRPTASGAPFRMARLTAAHRTLALGTRVRVTNLANGRSVEVEINDRGPARPGREIDLSAAAADRLGMRAHGLARVAIVPVGE